MTWERLELPVDAPRVDRVSALFGEPTAHARARPLLLANGAGFHMESPWMAAVADGLRVRGFTVLRFNGAPLSCEDGDFRDCDDGLLFLGQLHWLC